MGININSAITPATGVGGTTGQAFQHGRGRRAFIDSPNGRMGIARHEVATQCRETGRGLTTKVPAGRLNLRGIATADEGARTLHPFTAARRHGDTADDDASTDYTDIRSRRVCEHSPVMEIRGHFLAIPFVAGAGG